MGLGVSFVYLDVGVFGGGGVHIISVFVVIGGGGGSDGSGGGFAVGVIVATKLVFCRLCRDCSLWW